MGHKEVITRFAPSPTGMLHVGALRTALFDYLFAKNQGGKFFLRIEDTDQERLVSGSLESIIESLQWAGLSFDNDPVFQSKRLAVYEKHAAVLVEKKLAYYCNCSKERLEELRNAALKAHTAPKYDRHCLSNPVTDRTGAVIRFLIPENKTIVFEDLIRGEVSFESDNLDDFVIIKSDGFPTYHFANVIDDHEYNVSHVIRGDEWISSTPKHLLLYEALSYTPPQFAHVPQILGSDKTKLSKRHGAKSVLEYRDEGILPDALLNFLALLGWHSKDDREIFNLDGLISEFRLSDVQKSPAVFDINKLLFINGEYLRKLSLEDYILWLKGAGIGLDDEKKLKLLAALLKDRTKNYSDAIQLSYPFISAVSPDAELLLENLDKETALKVLKIARETIEKLELRKLEEALREQSQLLSVKTKDFFMLLRVSVLGAKVSPPLIESFEILGKEEVIKRLADTLKVLEK